MTTSLVPSANASGLPRTLLMVTVRPVRLRAAVTPSATIVDGLTSLRSEIEPNLAAFDLIIIRALAAAFTTHLMREVLHGAGDESLFPRYASVLQRLIENSARWPNGRLAGEILFVAWLLAHQHQRSPAGALSGTACVASR